ncbi:MAG: hypothetical protein V7L21_19210 [Nostoc sp.]|uniref:hypothetical protein n=1 Tax=unclassified Nostoc TaxID=2593658 RepID=UPI0025D1E371|nr:hypothetical protein [Nostoc sp. NMS9]
MVELGGEGKGGNIELMLVQFLFLIVHLSTLQPKVEVMLEILPSTPAIASRSMV